MTNHNTLPLSDGVNNTYPISQTFNFDNLPVRITDRDGEIWFIANDVCAVLEHSNAKVAISRLDDDEKSDVAITDNLGRSQTVNIISESGLYALVMTSRKAEAKRFKRWVTHEVLPAIRKTGAYSQEQRPAIEDKRRRGQLEHPNYALASEVAARAAQAVFEALLVSGEDWLRNQRLLLSMQQASKYKPIVKHVAPDAYVASLADLIKMIEGGAFLSMKDLIDLAAACNARLAKNIH